MVVSPDHVASYANVTKRQKGQDCAYGWEENGNQNDHAPCVAVWVTRKTPEAITVAKVRLSVLSTPASPNHMPRSINDLLGVTLALRLSTSELRFFTGMVWNKALMSYCTIAPMLYVAAEQRLLVLRKESGGA